MAGALASPASEAASARSRRWAAPAVAGMALVLWAAPAAGQPVFVDVTAGSGIFATAGHDAAMGWGAAAADYDGDGDIDLFVPNPGQADQLFRNQGGGLFEEIAAQVGVASTAYHKSALWLDCEGDGDLDLLVAGDCMLDLCAPGQSVYRLYRQDSPGAFTDVTAGDLVHTLDSLSSATRSFTRRTGLAAADLFGGDGLIDFYAGYWSHGKVGAQVYKNLGGCVFDDVTAASGIDVIGPGGPVGAGDFDDPHQMMIHDFDGDDLMDIFVAVDFWPNHLWINQGDGSFLDEAASAGVHMAYNSELDGGDPPEPIGLEPFNEMGVTLGDPDRDGDFDVYITNIYRDGRYNTLYQNDSAGSLSFTEVADGTVLADTAWGWGTTFFDAENDGWVDLAATNGWDNAAWGQDLGCFFTNLFSPPLEFRDDSAAAGLDDDRRGSTLLSFDADRDGDLDLFQTVLPVNFPAPAGSSHHLLSNQLMEGASEGAAPGYLVIRPRMDGPNSHSIGAVVRAQLGGAELLRLISAGTSYMGQEPAEAFFGLGAAATVDQVTVEWPGSTQTSVAHDVAADQVLDLNHRTGPMLFLSRGALEYPDGPGPTTLDLVLSNATAGAAQLTVSGMALSDPSAFSLDTSGPAPACGGTSPAVAPGAACGVTVEFDPPEPTIASATLTITSDSAVGPVRAVPLAGCSASTDLTLTDVVMVSEAWVACRTLSAGGGFTVTGTGAADLLAGSSIVFTDDFSVENDGVLTAALAD